MILLKYDFNYLALTFGPLNTIHKKHVLASPLPLDERIWVKRL